MARENRRESREKQEKFQSFSRPKLKITRISAAGEVYIDYKDTESLRKKLICDQIGAGEVHFVQALFVILQSMLFTLFEGFEGGGVAEEVGDAGGEFGPGSPGAGGIGGFTAELANPVAERLCGTAMVGL